MQIRFRETVKVYQTLVLLQARVRDLQQRVDLGHYSNNVTLVVGELIARVIKITPLKYESPMPTHLRCSYPFLQAFISIED
jgi:hypothetical protein